MERPMERYVCESCDGTGTRRVALDRDVGKDCLTCSGRGFLSESEMDARMRGTKPNVLDWHLFARIYRD